jgi:hypothetical protein
MVQEKNSLFFLSVILPKVFKITDYQKISNKSQNICVNPFNLYAILQFLANVRTSIWYKIFFVLEVF